MQANRSLDKTDLTLRTSVASDAAAFRAHMTLLRTVFGDVPAHRGVAPSWVASGFFDRKGNCIASLEIAGFDLVLDGVFHAASGIRLVAVDPDWRGQGLSRDLMTNALATTAGLVLLYAEMPDLYLRYGFRSMPQYAFVGEAPVRSGAEGSRRLDPEADRALIDKLLSSRAPVSNHCAIVGAPGLFLDRLSSNSGIRLTLLDGFSTILAHEIEEETLVLVDIVAATIPTLSSILGALGGCFTRVRTLFPPDKLDWRGDPVPDDTGLMIRGPVPPAMTVPFMLPSTTEF